MHEFKKVTSSEVPEKLTICQIERIWQQVDKRKQKNPNPLSLQVFWFAGVEVWVVSEGGIKVSKEGFGLVS